MEMFFFDPLKTNIECDGGFLFSTGPCFWLGKRKCFSDANHSLCYFYIWQDLVRRDIYIYRTSLTSQYSQTRGATHFLWSDKTNFFHHFRSLSY